MAGRHADNVAPSLLGGAVLVQGLEPFRHVSLVVHPSVRLVLVMPGYEVATARARALPFTQRKPPPPSTTTSSTDAARARVSKPRRAAAPR